MDTENSIMEVDEALDLRAESRKSQDSVTSTNQASLSYQQQQQQQLIHAILLQSLKVPIWRLRRTIPPLFEALISSGGEIDQESADVEFYCKDGQVVKGHRIILKLSSVFFTTLFKEQDTGEKTIISVPEASASAIRNVLEFCYKQQVSMDSDDEIKETVYWLKQFGFNRERINGAERFWPSDDLQLNLGPDLPWIPSLMRNLEYLRAHRQINPPVRPIVLNEEIYSGVLNQSQESQLDPQDMTARSGKEAETKPETSGQSLQIDEGDMNNGLGKKLTYWLAVPNAGMKSALMNRDPQLSTGYNEDDTATFYFGDLSITKSLSPLSSFAPKEDPTSPFNFDKHQTRKLQHPAVQVSSPTSQARPIHVFPTANNKFPATDNRLLKSAILKSSSKSIQKVKRVKSTAVARPRNIRQLPILPECLKNMEDSDDDRERIRWIYGCRTCGACFESALKAHNHWLKSRLCSTQNFQSCVFKYRQGFYGRFVCPLCPKRYTTLYGFSVHCIHNHAEYKKLLSHAISEDKIKCVDCERKFEGPRDFHSHLGPSLTCGKSVRNQQDRKRKFVKKPSASLSRTSEPMSAALKISYGEYVKRLKTANCSGEQSTEESGEGQSE